MCWNWLLSVLLDWIYIPYSVCLDICQRLRIMCRMVLFLKPFFNFLCSSSTCPSLVSSQIHLQFVSDSSDLIFTHPCFYTPNFLCMGESWPSNNHTGIWLDNWLGTVVYGMTLSALSWAWLKLSGSVISLGGNMLQQVSDFWGTSSLLFSWQNMIIT